MPKIVRFHETGGADVLKLEDLPLAEPGEGEVRLKVEAIGLNRADVMFRQGQYLQHPEPPHDSAMKRPGPSMRWGPGSAASKRVTGLVRSLLFPWASMASTAKAPSSRSMLSPDTPTIYRPLKALRSGCNT